MKPKKDTELQTRVGKNMEFIINEFQKEFYRVRGIKINSKQALEIIAHDIVDAKVYNFLPEKLDKTKDSKV
ncbi:hypothetical protein C0585_01020 [Candidatus Woesearchaeota archaeon]|uniref:hypothetical protein n=1 Tax=uncultured Arcobacter sp. TaxID=165434 RepID=UPI000CB31DAF|nr:hypothetical protein [uncultured Arcobacter sp.]PLW80765.1 MAG: hypothetical protein C0585_01020 [Candidatus Woesearchaeota archaeon]